MVRIFLLFFISSSIFSSVNSDLLFSIKAGDINKANLYLKNPAGIVVYDYAVKNNDDSQYNTIIDVLLKVGYKK